MTEATDAAAAAPSPHASPLDAGDLDRLANLVHAHAPVAVLCGAGCSTASGIPDYRDAEGAWKQRQPMQYAEFMSGEPSRRRYWARSMVGWPRFRAARANATHRALAALERSGHVGALITQNVDGLHRLAGQGHVIDLHGRLAEVVCTGCGEREARDAFQQRMIDLNPGYHRHMAGADDRIATVADGDAMVESGYDDLCVAACLACGGVLKPDVVFFGEAVPTGRVEAAYAAVAAAGALLVVGSSLMVYSGYRFARAAKAAGKPLAIVNRGRTRADAEADIKIEHDCAQVLDALVARLAGQ